MRINYEIVCDNAEYVLIKDCCAKSNCMSLTNGAEEAVSMLDHEGMLANGKRLFYIDTDNRIDEMLVKQGANGRFSFGGFKCGHDGVVLPCGIAENEDDEELPFL